jgi:thioredoxin 1
MSDKILKFSATWCQPCKMLTKQLEGEDFGVPLQEVDIDANESLAKEFGIRGVPTLVLVRDGQEVKRLSGVNTATVIRETFGL